MVRLSLIYYGGPGPEVSARIINTLPEYLVCNTAQGLWGNVNGRSAGWSPRDIGKFRDARIRTIGYITAGYEGTGSGGDLDTQWYSLDINSKFIERMAEEDGVDGVFIDECTAFPSMQAKHYLKKLTDLAHEHKLIAWGNVGENDFDTWFFTDGGFDFMHSTEQWRGQRLTSVQKKYGRQISITGLDLDHNLEVAVELTLDAWKKGLAYCYITDSYLSLPDWFENYVSEINSVAERSSYP